MLKAILTDASSDGGLIDELSQKQYAAQALNYSIWPVIKTILNPQEIDLTAYMNGELEEIPPTYVLDENATYDGEVATIKQWTRDRIAWVDENLAQIRELPDYELMLIVFGTN